jgi:hypothetical protein
MEVFRERPDKLRQRALARLKLSSGKQSFRVYPGGDVPLDCVDVVATRYHIIWRAPLHIGEDGWYRLGESGGAVEIIDGCVTFPRVLLQAPVADIKWAWRTAYGAFPKCVIPGHGGACTR